MKATTLFAALVGLALFIVPVGAETRDPAPIVADTDEARPDDGRHFIGTQRVLVCENGVCRFVNVTTPDPVTAATAKAPVAKGGCPNCSCVAGECGSATCSTAAARVATAAPVGLSRPVRSLFERVRSWYPGKLFQAFRANRAAARGFGY